MAALRRANPNPDVWQDLGGLILTLTPRDTFLKQQGLTHPGQQVIIHRGRSSFTVPVMNLDMKIQNIASVTEQLQHMMRDVH